MPSRRARTPTTSTTAPTPGAIVRAARRDLAHHLGFRSARAYQRWEDEIVVDHFANFVCDYMAHGYTVVPDRARFVERAEGRDGDGLAAAIAARVALLEQAQFEVVLNPDKWDWTAEDHYRQFVVGVVADDVWLHMHDVPCAKLHKRQWSPQETALKMFDLLQFLIWEWRQGAGNGAAGHGEKDGQVQVSVREV